MQFTHRLQKVAILVAALLVSLAGVCQDSPGSPYTYFGLGDITPKGFGHALGLGGTGITYRSNIALNNLNPASYSAIGFPNTFISESGLATTVLVRSDDDRSVPRLDMKFPYIAFGFSTGDSSGVSIGLRQYSNVKYNIISADEFDGIQGRFLVDFTGRGGLNEFYFGYGKYLSKRLSVGLHASIVFGSLINEQTITSQSLAFDVEVKESIFLSTPQIDFGFQYEIPLGRSSLAIGGTYSPYNLLTGNSKTLVSELDDTRLPIDTLQFEEVVLDEDYVLPHSIGVGIGYTHQQKWNVMADYRLQLWSALAVEGTNFSIRDSQRASIGFQRLPNYEADSKAGWLALSGGLFYEQTYLELDGLGLDAAGFTLGIGYPMASRGYFRLIFERGTRGEIRDEEFNDTYSKITLNFTFLDFWFAKRRIN